MPPLSALSHYGRGQRSGGICPCCPFVIRAVKSFWDLCFNYLLKGMTGLNRIERTLTGASALDLLLYHPPHPSHTLDNSVIKRVELLIYKKLHSDYKHLLESPQLASEDLERGVESLGCFFGVQSQYLPVLKAALKEIRKAYWSRQSILEVQKTPFDPSSPEHIQTLHKFWDALMDGLPLPQRYGMVEETSSSTDNKPETSWSDVGFQSVPAKDFRSAGYLGALNLLWFSEKHRLRARQVLADTSSTQSRSWFPFAATGLNVTIWLLNLMNDGHLDVFFFNNTKSTPVEIFNVIYSFVFLEFSRFWRLSRPLNILQFGDVSRQFLGKIEETLEKIASPSYHSEWMVPLTSTGDELIAELRSWIDGDMKQQQQSTVRTTRDVSPASRLVESLTRHSIP